MMCIKSLTESQLMQAFWSSSVEIYTLVKAFFQIFKVNMIFDVDIMKPQQ